jgi:hypothetical protein
VNKNTQEDTVAKQKLYEVIVYAKLLVIYLVTLVIQIIKLVEVVDIKCHRVMNLQN